MWDTLKWASSHMRWILCIVLLRSIRLASLLQHLLWQNILLIQYPRWSLSSPRIHLKYEPWNGLFRPTCATSKPKTKKKHISSIVCRAESSLTTLSTWHPNNLRPVWTRHLPPTNKFISLFVSYKIFRCVDLLVKPARMTRNEKCVAESRWKMLVYVPFTNTSDDTI